MTIVGETLIEVIIDNGKEGITIADDHCGRQPHRGNLEGGGGGHWLCTRN